VFKLCLNMWCCVRGVLFALHLYVSHIKIVLYYNYYILQTSLLLVMLSNADHVRALAFVRLCVPAFVRADHAAWCCTTRDSTTLTFITILILQVLSCVEISNGMKYSKYKGKSISSKYLLKLKK
jgi:hypothetical protein